MLFKKNNRNPDYIYGIIRLLLPNDDKKRGNYGLKERNLAKLISECLNLSKADYEKLYHYKNPAYHKSGIGIGDFSLCTYEVIKNLTPTSS